MTVIPLHFLVSFHYFRVYEIRMSTSGVNRIVYRVVGFLWCLWCIKLWVLGGASAATRIVGGGASQNQWRVATAATRLAGMKVKAVLSPVTLKPCENILIRNLCETYSRYSTCMSKVNWNYRTTELNYSMSIGRRFSTVFPHPDACSTSSQWPISTE